jgi:hypothetical protein
MAVGRDSGIERVKVVGGDGSAPAFRASADATGRAAAAVPEP